MPNWCENSLKVIGNKESLTKFKEQAKSKEEGIETDIRMNNFVTMPKGLINTISPWEHPNWYEWALENWGTKWDLTIKWLENIGPMFPELTFELEYREGGMCFQGFARAKDKFFISQEKDYYEEFIDYDIRHQQAMEDLKNMRFL